MAHPNVLFEQPVVVLVHLFCYYNILSAGKAFYEISRIAAGFTHSVTGALVRSGTDVGWEGQCSSLSNTWCSVGLRSRLCTVHSTTSNPTLEEGPYEASSCWKMFGLLCYRLSKSFMKTHEFTHQVSTYFWPSSVYEWKCIRSACKKKNWATFIVVPN